MARAYISLGSNLGNPTDNLRRAIELLDQPAEIAVAAVSDFHRSAPIGPPQPFFLNAAAELETNLDPAALLAALKQIEVRLGRRPTVRWGPRVIDLDLLLYGELTLSTPALQLPHPEMARRDFVLAPLAEIAPDVRHPIAGLTARELFLRLGRRARDAARPWFIAVTGPIGAGKSTLAEKLADRLSARLIREEVAANRLLGPFYAEPSRHALNAQLWFLLERARQLRNAAADANADRRIRVSDYAFCNDRIFAGINLAPMEMEIYEAAAKLVGGALPEPDVVILLTAPVEILLQRVRARARAAESPLTVDYLARAAAAYDDFFARPAAWPVVRLETAAGAGFDDAVMDDLLIRIAEAATDKPANRQAR